MIELRSEALSAVIDPFGAELVSLKDAQGRELMSDGDPAFWTGRAPLLFPIVGALNGDRYRHADKETGLAKHGFARRRAFAVEAAGADHARLTLCADAETWAVYPWRFVLAVEFRLAGATLDIGVSIVNEGAETMYASFGFHPAFAWPLPYGRARADHRIVFDQDEPEPLCVLDAQGLIAANRESPIDGRTLHLDDSLFVDDALIWDRIRSASVRYGASDGPQLRIDFPDSEQLGVWTKPGAAFVCIEPWNGIADPKGYAGDFADKPGVFAVENGRPRNITMRVTLEP